MIRWLYSNTVSKGIPEHVWSPKQTDVHFANAWIQGVIDHPEKGIFVKNVGLQFLEDKDYEVFKEFDIVYTHLISIGNIGGTKWHDFPMKIKNVLGSEAPKVMMAIDNEMGHIPPQPQIKRALDNSDLIAAVTTPVLREWAKATTTPVRYIPAPKYYHKIRDPVPYDKRKPIMAIMRHTWNPPDESTGVRTQLEVASRLGCRIRIFTGWFNESAEKTMRWATRMGIPVNKVETFTRLDRIEYFDKLSECWFGIEDEYIGASRFAAEAACLKIPIIGVDEVTGARVANPDLVTGRRNVAQKVELGRKLLNDHEFYVEQAEGARKRIISHYDAGNCLDRLKAAWEEIGVQ